jgi:O-antigen/teichoic acid export membrane protein
LWLGYGSAHSPLVPSKIGEWASSSFEPFSATIQSCPSELDPFVAEKVRVVAESLRSKAVSGARWLSGVTLITAGLTVAQNIVLSRLLSPYDFGLSAMVWVFLGFAQMLSDGGMSLATIQRQTITKDALSTVHWSNVVLASFIAATCYVCRPLWVAYFHEPTLSALVPWGAATLVIAALGQQFNAVAQRNFQFSRLAISEGLAAVAGFTAAITLALWNWGVYALVLGGVVSVSMRTIALCAFVWPTWHPTIHWNRQDLRGFLKFGSYRLGDGIANYIWNTADYMVIGRVLGSSALGYYRLAFEIVVRPLAMINPILNKISFPIFAARQSNDEVLRRGFLEMIRLIASLVAPMMMGLIAIAPIAVKALLGPNWAPVAILLQILSPLMLLRCLLNSTAQINLAKGRVAAVFFLNLALAIILPLGFLLAVPHGLVVFCITEVLLFTAVMFVVWRPLHRATLSLAAEDYLLAVGKPLLLSSVMGLCVYILSLVIPTSWHPMWIVLVLIATGVLSQFVLIARLDRKYFQRLLSLIGTSDV